MCTIPQPSRKRNYNSSSQGCSKLIKTEQPMSSRNKDKIPMVKVEPEYNDDPNVICLHIIIYVRCQKNKSNDLKY